ncbi:B12-binding domain-containing radical SAM protein [Clostridium fallax]|uniref:Anaerobic magnesium-protoporphyrin IX monomethyl ester cyclase n=1 Tax=Clostridium fallax TaxID=1533 RepID=A0A1M4U4Q1_9CLOT|nr:B12-binding domain-containing radical SAM protein [Clostridium fallax]SHE51655.1 anaerobic magnesium-protoporphyrin IX monomethyl ester cyclase [Clostridium fallax]SQB06077.1 radical SAM domain-containing protein [Clostridium fallax]
MKVLLTAVNSKFIHSNLAVRYLKAYTKDLNYESKIREFSINDRIEIITEEIMKEKPDIIAFSCYIWNMEYVNRLSELIKLIDENIKILYGGPEVSFNSDEFLKNSSGDYVIEGEGEETYKEFIEKKIKGENLEVIKGLYVKKENGDISYGGIRPQMDMDKLIFPYNEEDNFENKIIYYEASRGCPFNCKYCLSSTIKGVRFLPIDRVKKELKFFIDKKVRLVKFVDRTFNCNHDYTKEIWSFLSKQDTETRFHFEIAADILKEDEIEILNKAPKGRFQLEVGVQTTNNEVLKNINRFIDFEHIKEKVLGVQRGKNVIQHLDLIAGLPGEDYNSFRNSFNDVYSISPDELQLGFLKLLKGSLMRMEAEKWGIIYSPYAPYEIIKSKDLSYEDLMKLKRVEAVLDKYYNSQKFNTIINFFKPKFSTPFDFYYELGEFFEKKGYFNRNIGNVEYYKVFLDFNEDKFNREEEDVLKELIKYDYLMFNKKKWLPDFLIRDMKKEEEREIRFFVNENFEKKRYHIERFRLDITEYIDNNKIKFSPCYLIFDEENCNNIIDITDKI